MIVKYPHVHIKVEIVNSPLKLKSETPRCQGWRSQKRISCWFVGVHFFFLRFLVVLRNGCVFPTTDVSDQNSEAGGGQKGNSDVTRETTVVWQKIKNPIHLKNRGEGGLPSVDYWASIAHFWALMVSIKMWIIPWCTLSIHLYGTFLPILGSQ